MVDVVAAVKRIVYCTDDSVSGAANYPAAKLIHFGDVLEGVAYLSRRLLENRSGFPGPTVERRLLTTELANRLLRRYSR